MVNLIKKNLEKITLLVYTFLLPVAVYAQQDPPCDGTKGQICNPLGNTSTVPALLQKILEGLLKIGIPVVALAIIYCGFLFVAARGKPEEITKAKDALLYTLIGAAILLGAWALAKMISSTVLAF